MKKDQFIIMLNPRLLLLIIGLCTFQLAQSQIKKADDLYEDFGYQTSIPFYESFFSSKDDPDLEALERIANSCRLVHDTENAEKWYEQLIKHSENPLHILYYAQALQSPDHWHRRLSDHHERFHQPNSTDPERRPQRRHRTAR